MCLLNSNDVRKIFQELDIDEDGFVSIEDLECFLGKIGVCIGVDELESIAGRRCFDLEEFTLFCKQDIGRREEETKEGCSREEETKEGCSREEESDLVEAFKVFDSNNDGFISSDEIQCVLSRLGLWEGDSGSDGSKMICEFDTNSDGVLDFEEFKTMMLMFSQDSH